MHIMDSLKLNDICVTDSVVCRICLEEGTMLNWNEEMFEFYGTTYKDCYYKYTDLPETDEFSTNFCEHCADGLKNSHLLFKKALDSFQILELASKRRDEPNTKFCVKEPEEIHETFEYIITKETSEADNFADKKDLIENEIYLENMCVVDPENDVNSSMQLTIKCEDGIVQPEHFIDVRNYESDDILLPPELSESFDSKINNSAAKKPVRKRKELDSFTVVLVEEKECDGVVIENLPKSRADRTRNTGKRKSGSSPEILLEERCDYSCDVDISEPSITNTRKEKNEGFMCSYCSLILNSFANLIEHESNHSKDRQRTQICPKCGIKLFTLPSLKCHMATHDENRIRKHKCEFCEKAFFYKSSLNVHRRIHLGLLVKCQICLKKYSRQGDLDKHLLTHSTTATDKKGGRQKYTIECQYCNRHIMTTKWREHANAHRNEPLMQCKICNKDFKFKKSCLNHLERVHGKKKDLQEFIHKYVDFTTRRMSHLIMTQTEAVIPLK